MRMQTIVGIFVLIVFSVIKIEPTFSQEDPLSKLEDYDEELEQELRWLKAETYVITASKVEENIKKAPASITVITDRQIRQMGAKDLRDVLRAVPGFRASYFYVGYSDCTARALSGTMSNGILLMINGHPVNQVREGGFAWLHDTLIVDNAKRIEFIRGPGSALYGANAYHGVINVITKEAEDIDGFELIARAGSWDTQQYNLLYGKTFNDLEVAFDFNYFKTHGFRGFIEEDLQTQFDRLTAPFGIPPASLAPGRMAGDDEKYEAALNLKYKGFTFDGRYVDREKDLGVGTLPALNEKSISSPKDYYLNLSYEASVWEGLDLTGKVYRNYEDGSSDVQNLPPGAVIGTPTGIAIMPNGLLSQNSYKDSRMGVEIQATYKLTDSNTLLAGATYEEQKVYDNKTSANFLPTLDPDVWIPLLSIQRWPDILVMDTERRNFKAVFLEDIWDITDDLRLTTGVRYDSYSDFGSEISPRVGLTWEYIKGYDLKLLYGHAFRAPSFYELHAIEGGNPTLDPEEVDMWELSLGAEFTTSFNGRVTLFHRETKRGISPSSFVSPWNFINLGKVRTHGFEVEAKYNFGRGTYISGNYMYYDIPTIDTPAGIVRNTAAPRHMGGIMANIRLSRYLNFNVDCYFEDGFYRDYVDVQNIISGSADFRDDMSGYAIVNATLIAKKFLKGYDGLELRGSVYNLFDKDYTHPMGPEIPNDLPMPGINYLLELKYMF